MKIFVTGASGFVGSAVTSELAKLGHEVIGLARSDNSARKIESLGPGVKTLRGDLEDLQILKEGASQSDAVIHLGFVHDFNNYDRCCEIDRRAAVAMLDVLVGSEKSFLFTNGTFALSSGRLVTEKDGRDPSVHNLRGTNEEIVLTYKTKGVRVMCARLAPTVHGMGDKTFIPMLIEIAKNAGKSGYIGDGQNVWAAIHRLDAAHLYTLILEKGKSGNVYHGVAEEGVKSKNIAKVIGDILHLPVVSIKAENAEEHFGSMAPFFAKDNPVSSVITRKELSWQPQNLELLADMRENYLSN